MIALSTDQFDESMSRTGTAREAPAAKIIGTTQKNTTILSNSCAKVKDISIEAS